MTRHITVTPTEVSVAQLHIELAEMLGEQVSPAIVAIARAERRPLVVDRDAVTLNRTENDTHAS